MLLQSGHSLGAEHLGQGLATAATISLPAQQQQPRSQDVSKHLDNIQDTLKEGWTVHTAKDGRLYYCNHITRTAGWLPPAESWGSNEELPYGWERALDQKGRPYYINHINKTTTYEAPDFYRCDEPPPEPRIVNLQRSPTMGFGFVAGSERPVIVRFVTEGGPSVHKLEPGDQILSVNGEDVKDAPRDHVIQLVRSCESCVTLLVCQPSANGASGRKSTLLSAGKKAKLRTRPSRVRFAESVCVNGAPLFPPSAFSLGDLCVPPMANVLKVFLENGQTKSFKYDATTTVQDVVASLRDKLCLSASEHFSLVLEHVKSLKRNKLTLLDPQETLVRIAARPGAHKLRCLFRVTFVPVSAAILAQRDLNSLDYLFMQCCNDVTQERFAPELQPDVALRLAALHMHQHALANNISPAKLTVKTVEREFGLERFVPTSLIDGMKRKELRRLIAHFLKLNSQMTGSSTKMLTQLQAKIHYLDIISSLPSYGAKCFSTNQRDGVERVLLVSPRFGLSQIAGIRNSVPQPISTIEELMRVTVNREDDVSYSVAVYMQLDRLVTFSMEDRDAAEFALVLAGYYRLLSSKELIVDLEREITIEDIAPPYLSQHSVLPSMWNYIPPGHGRAHSMAFSMPPPYHSTKYLSTPGKTNEHSSHCDRNMNTTLSNNNHTQNLIEDEFGFDIHSVMSMEILEGTGKGHGMNGLVEARNEEVMRRVVEMQKMVETSERYLNEQGELINDLDINPSIKYPWRQTSLEMDSDCDSMNSSKLSSNEDAPGVLKHSDSLILLAECISQDLTGITNDLNSICSPFNETSNGKSLSQQSTPKVQRRMQGLSQLLSDLQAIGNDLSQSESDSESVYTPNNSPIHRNQAQQFTQRTKAIRTSFGLHSPDSSVLTNDPKDTNLKEYLRQLREASNNEGVTQNTDFAAKKISELYGFEIGEETLIETDPDLIDLTSIPPPQTPDELDALQVLNAAPSGFDDSSKIAAARTPRTNDDELEKFLAKVIIAPPTQKITPAKELTPEEILSFIIPPPPGLGDDELHVQETEPPVPIAMTTNTIIENSNAKCNGTMVPPVTSMQSYSKENLYSNSSATLEKVSTMNKSFLSSSPNVKNQQPHVIEYPTIDRKGPFSCCTKTKKEEPQKMDDNSDEIEQEVLTLPPRLCQHNVFNNAPERPPKSVELQLKLNSPTRIISQSSKLNGDSNLANYYEIEPPSLPPRLEETNHTPPSLKTLPPKKPPLPPVPLKSTPRSPIPILKNPQSNNGNDKSSPIRVAGINSPHFYRHLNNSFRDVDRAFSSSSNDSSPTIINRTNGHFRSHSDCPPVCLQNPSKDNRPQLTLLCSPQMSRKPTSNLIGSPQLSSKNGHIINAESLLNKTDVAMAGLLVKLDQVAAMCSAAQAAGGGSSIDEDKFQAAREELTDQALSLVTASKLLVVALSDPQLASLPEHLTSCLTALRRVTELTQDMTRHTSSPLQTRNIVLKVHDVASSFRELAGVKIGPLGAGQLALQAECLANVLATLLRSLRVFSP